MNKKVSFLAVLVCQICLFGSFGQAQTLYWGNPMEVAPNTYHNLRPQIGLTGDGEPVVLWGSSLGSRKGWVSRWNGSGFDTPVQANPSGSINAYTVEGPNLAVQGDTAYLVYTTAPASSARIVLRSSFDGGQTWAAPVWVDSLVSDLPTFPSVAILPGGNPIVLYMRQQSNYANPRYVSHRSTDGGLSWLPEVPVSAVVPGAEVCDCCTGTIQAEGNRVWVAFRNNDNNIRDMWMAVSDDGGQSFGRAIDLDSTNWQTFVCPSSGPDFLLDGDSIRTVFMSRDQGPSRIFVTSTHVQDSVLSNQFMIDPSLPANLPQNYPSIAGAADTVGIVWSGHNGTDVDLMFSYRVAGQAFSQPLNVVDSASGAQSYADLAYARGTFHLVYADNSTGKVMYQVASFDQSVGIEVNPYQGQLLAWPNPASTSLRLKWPGHSGQVYRLYDVSGRLLREWPWARQEQQFQRNGIPTGTYVVRLEEKGRVVASLRVVFD